MDDLLRRVPYFSSLQPIEMARLIGVLERTEVSAGGVLIRESDEANSLYVIERGRIEVYLELDGGERLLNRLEAPCHVGELGLFLSRRTSSVRALTEVVAWKLPRARLEQVARERPEIAFAVATAAVSLLERRERELVGAPVRIAEESARSALKVQVPARSGRLGWRLAGAALALALPAALWWLSPPAGLTPEGWHVLLIVLGAAVGWLFEPLPDFVVALLMVAAWGLTGLTPLPRAFAGFASAAWIVGVGSLLLAAVMARTGLLFRLALTSLRLFPATHWGQLLALVLGGLVVTPLVPLRISRVAAVAPLTLELSEALGYPPQGRARASLAFAGIAGHGFFSSIFLSGLVMNFFVVGLLPAAERARFSWTGWLLAATPAGVVILAGTVLALLTLFRPEIAPRRNPDVVRAQEIALGPLSKAEVVALGTLGVFLAGLLLEPLTGIATESLAVLVVAIAFAGGVVDRELFRAGLDWGFLVLFGIMLGAGGVLHAHRVDAWIGDGLVVVGGAAGSPAAAVMLLAVLVCAVRLVVPCIPATLLLALAIVPVAGRVGLSPWLAGFVVLVSAMAWIHPNQSDFHRIVREATRGEMFSDRQGLVFGLATTATILLAILVSIPYWWLTGLLGRGG